MKKFKNDQERIAFLEDHRNPESGWYLWKEIEEIGRRWWRFDLPGDKRTGASFIVEEEEITIRWPKVSVVWIVRHWFIVTDWSGLIPFGDFAASKTMALNCLKQRQREGLI